MISNRCKVKNMYFTKDGARIGFQFSGHNGLCQNPQKRVWYPDYSLTEMLFAWYSDKNGNWLKLLTKKMAMKHLNRSLMVLALFSKVIASSVVPEGGKKYWLEMHLQFLQNWWPCSNGWCLYIYIKKSHVFHPKSAFRSCFINNKQSALFKCRDHDLHWIGFKMLTHSLFKASPSVSSVSYPSNVVRKQNTIQAVTKCVLICSCNQHWTRGKGRSDTCPTTLTVL